MDGIIIVKKEKGFTSFDVVAKLRGICKQKKIGHTGTLDPDATGVLPVCLGCATKLCDMLTDTKKVYQATLLLGIETDTQDTSGKVLSEQEVTASEEEVKEAIVSFIGEQLQIPPMYSALKVNGKKLCDLAREGKEVERKPRPIVIYDITIDSVKLPEVIMTVSCSKGTYIRTLCHDIGQKLGCGGAMKELVRLQTSGFCYEDSKTLDEIEDIVKNGNVSEILKPVDVVFTHLPKAIVLPDYKKNADNGNALVKKQLSFESEEATEIRIYGEDGLFYGIYSFDGDKNAYVPAKLFFYKR